jgi:uncharacterized protein YkwD
MFTSIATAVLFAFAAPANTIPDARVEPLHPVEELLVEKTNQLRIRHGLRALRLDHGLLRSARRHAAWMSRSYRLQHTTAAVAENIAMGQQTTSEAIQSWMNSPGHRSNMLSANYRRVGAAAYTAANGQTYWCIQFLD